MATERKDIQYIEKVVFINRVAKVVKGGRRFSFSALSIVGDGHGSVGYGSGKAKEVPDALRKSIERAKKNMIKIPLKGTTIPYEVVGHFGSGMVLLKPAVPGTGVIAGAVVRAIMEAAGVHDVLTKCLGNTNPFNTVYATFECLKQLQKLDELNKLRNLTETTVEEIL